MQVETHEEPHARVRDAAVRGAAEKRRIRVEQHCSDTLWEPAQLLAQHKLLQVPAGLHVPPARRQLVQAAALSMLPAVVLRT